MAYVLDFSALRQPKPCVLLIAYNILLLDFSTLIH
jgi:hypothetical protein